MVYHPICYPKSLIYKLTTTLEDPATSSIPKNIFGMQNPVAAIDEFPIETEGNVNSLEQKTLNHVVGFTYIKDDDQREALRPSTMLRGFKKQTNKHVFFAGRVRKFPYGVRVQLLGLIRNVHRINSIVFAQKTAEPDHGYIVVSEDYCDVVDRSGGQVIVSVPIAAIKKVWANGTVVTVTFLEEKQKGKPKSLEVKCKKVEVASLVQNVLLTQEAGKAEIWK
jgi:hypothetical protein